MEGPLRRRRSSRKPAAETATVSAAPPSPAAKTENATTSDVVDIGCAAPDGRAQSFDTAGAIDGLIGAAVLGWAYDRQHGRRRVKITMFIDDHLVLETTANGLRRELVGIDGHDGFSGFLCPIPPDKFNAGAVIRVFGDGTELTPTPLLLGSMQIDGIFEPLASATATGWVRERVREPSRAVLDMHVDGRFLRIVIADRLRPELREHGIADGGFGFAEALPDLCLDGSEHQIEFRHRLSGTMVAPGPRRFRATYVGVMERLDQYAGSGWVFCREAPDRPVRLDVVVNGERIAVTADRPRADVRDVHGVEQCGFDFRIPNNVSRHRGITADILVIGTSNPALPGPFTFTPVTRVIEGLEAVAARIAAAGTPGDRQVYSVIREAIVPGILDALRGADRQSGTFDLSLRIDLTQFRSPASAVAEIVDVVIPVYSGYDEAIACIGSVLRAANKTRREIVIVDDLGPDPHLRAALKSYERAGTITLIVNPANLGFPGAANAGMALHSDRDVILLNADTLVPDGWIDRLRAAAYRAANIGTVTPLSNRATICSYPEINQDNALPDDMTWEALDRLCADVNADRAIEIPTAVGFCAYLRRAMLREVGSFNTERWGHGYGEENELCILAAARGWKHHLAADLFVVHHGAVSFGADGRKTQIETNLATLNRLYPDYIPRIIDFLHEDPIAAVRRAIDVARLKQLSDRFMLHVSHRIGGGTRLHVEDLAWRLQARGEATLILEANADDRDIVTVRNLVLGTKSIYRMPADGDALLADLGSIGVWHVHFHQIMGGARWAALPEQLGCSYGVTMHDYAFFCPRIDLIDETGRYCGEPEIDVCERCIALNSPHPDLRDAYRDRGSSIAAWLRMHRGLLAGARRVFAPSRDAASRVTQHFPGIACMPKSHPEPERRVAIRRPASSGVARVAVIGAIGMNKGSELMLACARDALKRDLPIQFRLFGCAADEAALRRLPNVQVTGEYRREDLPRLAAENPCDLALFPGIWPETYCYALSDAYALGLYPIALDLGAVAERITAAKVGRLLPAASTPGEINAAIVAEVARGAQWPAFIEWGTDYADILNDYYELACPGGTVADPGEPANRRRNKS